MSGHERGSPLGSPTQGVLPHHLLHAQRAAFGLGPPHLMWHKLELKTRSMFCHMMFNPSATYQLFPPAETFANPSATSAQLQPSASRLPTGRHASSNVVSTALRGMRRQHMVQDKVPGGSAVHESSNALTTLQSAVCHAASTLHIQVHTIHTADILATRPEAGKGKSETPLTCVGNLHVDGAERTCATACLARVGCCRTWSTT